MEAAPGEAEPADNRHLHDLRGSSITWLAEAKADPKAAARLAGHADVKVTWALYQRVMRPMLEDAAQAVEGLTKPSTKEQEWRKGRDSNPR